MAVPAAAQQRVSIYTAHTANIVERLIPDFEKTTGIKADVVKAGSGDIINRAKAESANPKCDVIWSIGAELLEANADLLEPYQPKDYAMIADAFKTSGAWIPYTGIVNVFVVNTKKLKPEEYPKSWADLAQPRFKNQISMADAEKSGSAYMQLNTFLTIYGDKAPGWDKFKAVFANLNVSPAPARCRASSTTARPRSASRSRTTPISISRAAGRSPSSIPKTARPRSRTAWRFASARRTRRRARRSSTGR